MKNGNCRCEGCRQMFYSMTAFDMHKAGSYTGRTRAAALHKKTCGAARNVAQDRLAE